MSPVVDGVVVTDLFLQSWRQAGHTDEQLRLLKNLVKLTPAFETCHERFMFVEAGLRPGLYTRENSFGGGIVLVGYFGVRASLYLLDLLATADEVVTALKNPVTRVSILTKCEQIFNTWVTVR